jgi:hypothetical protein
VRLPSGEWTATVTILSTNAIDGCAGERYVRPVDFRRVCAAHICKPYMYSVSLYGRTEAKVSPDGRGRYIVIFRPSAVPCPHRPGEDAGTNTDYSTLTLWWASRTKLEGTGREEQIGPCGGGVPTTKRYVLVRTNPAANPPAEGP